MTDSSFTLSSPEDAALRAGHRNLHPSSEGRLAGAISRYVNLVSPSLFLHIPLTTCCLMLAHEMSHPYASTSDPVVSKHGNIISYSRPLEDQSRVVLLYPNHHSPPFLWPVAIAESPQCCTSFPTPSDLSETYLLHWQVGDPVFGKESVLVADTKEWDQVTQYLQAPVTGNREVVVCLLHVWNACHGCVDMPSIIAQKQTCTENWGGVFEDVKDRWSDLEKRIEGQELATRAAMLKFWPTA